MVPLCLRSLLPLLLLALETGLAAQAAQGPFDAATVVLDRTQAPFRRLVDFDLDGDLDAVGVWPSGQGDRYLFGAYTNDGAGGFSGSSSLGCNGDYDCGGVNELLIEVGHLDRDAWPDVCIVKGQERYDWTCHVVGGRAFFTPQPVVLLPSPDSVTAIALADLDRDGIDDLIWTAGAGLYLSTSSGGSSSILNRGSVHGLRVLPRNGPLASDLVVVLVGTQVRLFYGHPATGLVAGQIFATDVAMGMVDTGDIDGDGDVDAVVFGMASYRVLRRQTSMHWNLEPELVGGPAEFLRDVDGDGDLDGVCCSGGGGDGDSDFEDNVQPSDFQISINTGGVFAPAFAIRGLGSPQLAGVADLDQDGDLDLVAGRCIYFADGPIRPPREGTGPLRRDARSLCDCDGDGDVDAGFSVDSVECNNGRGRFVPRATGAWAPPGTGFVGPGYPGDFDGDGDVDLLAELSNGRMFFYGNDGGGWLEAPIAASEPGVLFALDAQRDPGRSLLVDTDRDGDLDLLTRTQDVSFDQARTRLWANTGTGFLRLGTELGVYRALWAGDVNLDGVTDLIACGAGYGGTSTYVLVGSNPRPEALPTLTWNGTSWKQEIDAGLGVGDVDRNGYPDFACALASPTGFPSNIQEELLLQNRYDSSGGLAFLSALDHGSDHLVPKAHMVLGRLDRNETLDALVGPLEHELVDICELRLQRATGQALTFDRIHQLVAPGELVDLDGDGDLDVLGARIAFNRRTPGRARSAGSF